MDYYSCPKALNVADDDDDYDDDGVSFITLRFYIPNANVIVGKFWPTQCLDYAMTHISM